MCRSHRGNKAHTSEEARVVCVNVAAQYCIPLTFLGGKHRQQAQPLTRPSVFCLLNWRLHPKSPPKDMTRPWLPEHCGAGLAPKDQRLLRSVKITVEPTAVSRLAFLSLTCPPSCSDDPGPREAPRSHGIPEPATSTLPSLFCNFLLPVSHFLCKHF